MDGYKIDTVSYELGMINCFVEMVACGVKKMAISPPIDPKDYELINAESEKMVKGFGIKSYLTHSLIVTDLQSEEFTLGKWSILYYDSDDVLDEYLQLVKTKEEYVRQGTYGGENRKEIARAFGRLLSYPEHKIEEKISQNVPPTPFTLV